MCAFVDLLSRQRLTSLSRCWFKATTKELESFCPYRVFASVELVETKGRSCWEDSRKIVESLKGEAEEIDKELWIPGFSIDETKSSSGLFTGSVQNKHLVEVIVQENCRQRI